MPNQLRKIDAEYPVINSHCANLGKNIKQNDSSMNLPETNNSKDLIEKMKLIEAEAQIEKLKSELS